MPGSTLFLGKLIGLYLIAISVGMLVNRNRTLATLAEMARSGPWMLFSGMAATVAGLAVLLGGGDGGGVLGVLVSLTGWLSLLKGLALLVVPPSKIGETYRRLGYERHFPAWMSVVLALGLALSALGFAG